MTNNERRPGENTGATKTLGDVGSILHKIGCVCGCLPGDGTCVTERPVRATGSGSCCGAMTLEDLAAAGRAGITCHTTCARVQLGQRGAA